MTGPGPDRPVSAANKSGKHRVTAYRHAPSALIVAAALIVLDQLTKWWALEALEGGRVIDLVWTLRLRLVFNTGAAFSSFEGLGPFLGIAAVVVAGVLLLNRRLVSDRWSAVAAGSIAGGALGNLADRLFRSDDGFLGGAVVDFIDVQWWPVWNVADMGVVLGGAALVWHAYRRAR